MQTFYTHENLAVNAQCLDDKRLNKQLLEGRQILDVLSKSEYLENGKVRPWAHHPAVLMWKGHEGYLYVYLRAIAAEMKTRGISYEKNMTAIHDIMRRYQYNTTPPSWITHDNERNKVIVTHRGNLYNKFKEHYVQFSDEYDVYKNSVCCARCNYYWPTH